MYCIKNTNYWANSLFNDFQSLFRDFKSTDNEKPLSQSGGLQDSVTTSILDQLLQVFVVAGVTTRWFLLFQGLF